MSRRIATVCLAAAVLLAAGPSWAQYAGGGGAGGFGGGGGGGGFGGGGGGGGGPPPGPSDAGPGGGPPGKIPLGPFSEALKLKQKGEYGKAMPMLRKLADLGKDYEVAELELGNCYFDLARANADPAAAARQRTQGLGWVLKAANGQFGAAEEKLVKLYLDGEALPVSRAEAGKWFILWRINPSRLQLGTQQFDTALQQRLVATLSKEDWADAKTRAQAWRPQ